MEAAADGQEAQTLAPPPPHEADAKVSVGSSGDGRTAQLQPWEQHAAVISLPRYDYRAQGSLLLRPHSGFLITCPIKREKSATKEAISILEEYINHVTRTDSGNLEPCDAEFAAKKRKLCSEVSPVEYLGNTVANGTTNISESSNEVGEDSSSLPSRTSRDADRSTILSLVKLSRSGLLFFSFPHNGFHHVVGMLSEMLMSLRSGKLKSPQWCHRILPVQETCVLSEAELSAVVSMLFQEFLRTKENPDKPIKFAVGYNRRGIEETEMKAQKNNSEALNQQALMDREQCFRVVAAAVKSVAENSVVDLKSPEVAVLVEILPLSGVPPGSSVAGVSVLPAELISTKPRLCVKSLVADTKATKRI